MEEQVCLLKEERNSVDREAQEKLAQVEFQLGEQLKVENKRVEALEQEVKLVRERWEEEKGSLISLHKHEIDSWMTALHKKDEELRQLIDEQGENKSTIACLEEKCNTLQVAMEELDQQNLKLSGHNNTKNKIQHHLQMKKEMNQLKREKEALEQTVRMKDQMIKKFQASLKQPPTVSKENVNTNVPGR
eukprot:TRINITY_DN10134_c0_g1_i2.p1 TRINITY_DN10134_c0_g1~~TRINITY_DN10134_c0_g1_i2.p1  ORF type:complete len:189 (-),score=75.63 TRINITY_DN10134_c0_g1_i2:88-654(-)